ncbi:MAG: tetratricopeptide repeat protein [Fibrobacter sp.]|nr:tetratricopeptide repeat protein [Fibrobacter sp.]
MSIVSIVIRLIRKKERNSLSILFIVFFSSIGFTQTHLPDEMHQAVLSVIDKVYNENFQEAEEDVRRIIKRYPDHPAGYFFMAVVLDAWMNFYQTNSKESEFYRYCDLAIEKGEKLLEKNGSGTDDWIRFFIGGADGYKGTFEARYERWITAFRFGWKGVSVLLNLEKKKSSIVDVNYGIGSYDYWRSAMIKVIWFMPKVEDRRQKGILRLYDARMHGIYTKNSASAALIDILLNESRFNDALQIANELEKMYPNCTLAKWGQAKALFGIKEYTKSANIFNEILNKVESASVDNHYNAALCHLWLAKIELAKGNYTEAVAQCNRMSYYEFEDQIRKRLEKPLNEAAGIKKQAISKSGRNFDSTLQNK